MEIISKASSGDELRKVLQTDMSLLVDAIYVLKMMHDAGKNGMYVISRNFQNNFLFIIILTVEYF